MNNRTIGASPRALPGDLSRRAWRPRSVRARWWLRLFSFAWLIARGIAGMVLAFVLLAEVWLICTVLEPESRQTSTDTIEITP